ncbi:MAG: hypothetical protein OEZ06_19180 [Myxococcales bacterium]|nr:hypothetical protein [Myxococcales bacterium]
MVAAQDVGGRERDPLDAVKVDSTESAEHVAKVRTEALRDKAGTRLLTDRGSPYMARRVAARRSAAGQAIPSDDRHA